MKKRPDCGTNTWVIHLNPWINQTAPFRMLVYTKDRYCLVLLFILSIPYTDHSGVTNVLNTPAIYNGFYWLWLPISKSSLPYSYWSLALTSLSLRITYFLKKKLFSIKNIATKMGQQIFCKGSNSKYFSLSWSFGLCYNYSSAIVVAQK